MVTYWDKLVIWAENLASQKKFWLFGILVISVGILVMTEGKLMMNVFILERSGADAACWDFGYQIRNPLRRSGKREKAGRETPGFT